MKVLACAVIMAAAIAGAPPIQPQQSFEVASVRPTKGAPGVPPFVFVQAGRLRAPFSTLRELVQAAHGVEVNQVVGGPGWADSDHFDVNAQLPPGATVADSQAMLRKLLADRFGLVTRQEQRELPVLFLDQDEKIGPQLTVADTQCKPLKSPPGIPAPPPPPPPPAGAGPMTPLNQPPGSTCGNVMFSGFFSLRAVPMMTFVTNLSRQIKRPIIDRTKLASRYDIDLHFLPDTGPMQFNGQAINADAPSLRTAIREQLGLRLDDGRAPLDVIVIDRVNQPTAN
jgi:uncharacterized protein (TIGR03435 family)